MKHFFLVLSYCLVLFCLLGFISPGISQAEEIQVTHITGSFVLPRMIASGPDFAIVWPDKRDGGEPEIYFTKVDENGNQVVSDTRVSADITKISYSPCIAWTGTEYGVAWNQYPVLSPRIPTDIYFARLNSEGVKQTSDILVASASLEESRPSLAFSGSEFGLVYTDFAAPESVQIFFRRLNSDGDPLGDPIQVTTNASLNQSFDLGIVWDGMSYAVIWTDCRHQPNLTYPPHIYFARLLSDGTKIVDDTRVTDVDDIQYPGIVWNGNDYAIYWVGYDSYGERQLYLNLVDDSGQKLLGDLQITENQEGYYSTLPSMVWNGHEYGLAWLQKIGELPDGESDYEIYFVRLSKKGKKKGQPVQLSTTADASSMRPSVAWNGTSYGVVWDGVGTRSIYYTEPPPMVDKVKPRFCMPGEKIRIVGYGFGDGSNNSVVHIGHKSFDSTSPKIRLWTDTKIRIKVPFKNKPCTWFKHDDGANSVRKVWVTVDGVDSNIRKIRVLKPDTCP